MGPLVSLLGLGSAAASAWVNRFRWPLLGLSVLLTVVSLYLAFVRHPSRRNRRIAAVAASGTVLALVRVLF